MTSSLFQHCTGRTAVFGRQKRNVETFRKPRQASDIARIYITAFRSQPQQTVDGAAVKQMPTERSAKKSAQRPLPTPLGPSTVTTGERAHECDSDA